MGMMPYEMKHGRKPDISMIRVQGSIAQYKAKGPNTLKLDPRARKAILIGYTDNVEVYKLWDLELRKVVYSRDVKIFEGVFTTRKKNQDQDFDLPDQAFQAPFEAPKEQPDEASSPFPEEEEELEVDLHSRSTSVRSTTLRPIVPRETKVEAMLSRPYTRSIVRTKPSIVIKIPRKTTDYYHDFHKIEKALLVDNDKENHLILLTNLSNKPSIYK